MDGVELIQPNADMLAIARLYLEKRDSLSDEERGVYLKLIRAMSCPLMKFSSPALRDKVTEMLREGRASD